MEVPQDLGPVVQQPMDYFRNLPSTVQSTWNTPSIYSGQQTPKQQQQRIWDRFMRGERSTTIKPRDRQTCCSSIEEEFGPMHGHETYYRPPTPDGFTYGFSFPYQMLTDAQKQKLLEAESDDESDDETDDETDEDESTDLQMESDIQTPGQISPALPQNYYQTQVQPSVVTNPQFLFHFGTQNSSLVAGELPQDQCMSSMVLEEEQQPAPGPTQAVQNKLQFHG